MQRILRRHRTGGMAARSAHREAKMLAAARWPQTVALGPGAGRSAWSGIPGVARSAAMTGGLGAVLLITRAVSRGVVCHSDPLGPAGLGRGDAAFFVTLSGGANRGPCDAPFLPFYPFLIRVLTPPCAGRAMAAAIIISCLSTVCGLYAVTMLALFWQGNEKAAHRAAWYAVVSPVSFFLLNGYSEGLFFGLSALCLLSAARSRWVWAAVLGALASVTRVWGIFLFPALLVGCVGHREGASPAEGRWRNVVTILLVPVAWLTCVLLVGYQSGNPWQVFTVERVMFHRSLSLPMMGAGAATWACFSGDFVLSALNLDKLLYAYLWLFVIWRGYKRLPLPLFTYLSSGALLLCIMGPYPLPWWSLDRFLLVLFPAYIVLGQMRWSAAVHRLVLLISFVLMLTQWVIFVNGYTG